MIKKPMQHIDDEIQNAAFEVNSVFAHIEFIPGKENFIADFLSQKEKTGKIDDIDRLLVGITDDLHITA